MTTFLDFIRKVHKEKKQTVAKHYGPGPHKGTGTPQKIHAGARQRKGTPKGTYAGSKSKIIGGWIKTKPWEASREDIINGKVQGLKYDRDLRALAQNRGSYIAVGDSFLKDDAEGRRHTLYHEVGHDVSAKMLASKKGRGRELLEPFRIDTGAVSVRSRYHNFAGLSLRPEEMIADVYTSLIHGEGEGYEGKKYKALYAGVKRAAKDLGYPAKSLFVIREGKWVEVEA